jgi:hypothetical protein
MLKFLNLTKVRIRYLWTSEALFKKLKNWGADCEKKYNSYTIDPLSHCRSQCGGSGMFIPDPGSELSSSRIPDPHQRI